MTSGDVELKADAYGPEAKACIAAWIAFSSREYSHRAFANGTPPRIRRDAMAAAAASGAGAAEMMHNAGASTTSPRQQQAKACLAA